MIIKELSHYVMALFRVKIYCICLNINDCIEINLLNGYKGSIGKWKTMLMVERRRYD